MLKIFIILLFCALNVAANPEVHVMNIIYDQENAHGHRNKLEKAMMAKFVSTIHSAHFRHKIVENKKMDGKIMPPLNIHGIESIARPNHFQDALLCLQLVISNAIVFLADDHNFGFLMIYGPNDRDHPFPFYAAPFPFAEEMFMGAEEADKIVENFDKKEKMMNEIEEEMQKNGEKYFGLLRKRMENKFDQIYEKFLNFFTTKIVKSEYKEEGEDMEEHQNKLIHTGMLEFGIKILGKLNEFFGEHIQAKYEFHLEGADLLERNWHENKAAWILEMNSILTKMRAEIEEFKNKNVKRNGKSREILEKLEKKLKIEEFGEMEYKFVVEEEELRK